ncbi:MAG: tetratricopeptide repeat protein, partial [Rickettsiales bacterium]|nr:tetratricopeptide repeat protein [Rickettsiales bacterium]
MSIKNISDFSIDSVRDFVERYLSQIIYLICFVLVVVFLIIFISNSKESKEKEITANYYQAINYLNSNNEDKAINILNSIYISKYATTDIKSMTALKLADLSISNNEVDKAIELYMEVYNMKKNDLFLKNLSGLNALNLMINNNG